MDKLLKRLKLGKPLLPRLRTTAAPLRATLVPSAGAQFLNCNFHNASGARPYKLYIPSGYRGQPMPLVVMLHGCTQSPDDFAAGTQMNAAAERQGFLVVYPEQTTTANMRKCWNWFNPSDQHRDTGEPSLIAGITRQIMRDYAVDRRRVYIAGLSAGGAAAAILGETYPDLYAAIGVHSGLASGAAEDVSSAYAAMQGSHPLKRKPIAVASRPPIPTIVFHGDQDTTVHASNADAVVAQSAHGQPLARRTLQGRVAGGNGYSRTLLTDAEGRTRIEQWMVHGAGHAWSGGSAAGSYTLPGGPDATGEMVRFFLEHPLPA